MSFLRTMSGAIGASIAASMWYDRAVGARSEIVGRLNTGEAARDMSGLSFEIDQARVGIERLVDGEALALATSQMFILMAVIFVASAGVIWLAPRTTRVPPPESPH